MTHIGCQIFKDGIQSKASNLNGSIRPASEICRMRYLGLAFLLGWLTSCKVYQSIPKDTPLSFLTRVTIPYKMQFEGTVVGGLSGIDYHAAAGTYYLISDDRSDHNPARFYIARIPFVNDRPDTVIFEKLHYFRQPGGAYYPSRKINPLQVPDPEAIRLHPKKPWLAWSSEGERFVRPDTVVINHPAIYISNLQGQTIDSFHLPANFRVSKTEKGPRQNGTIEAVAFTPDGRHLFACMEEPLYEDGHRAGTGDSMAFVRLVKFDIKSRKPVAQFVYPLDPVVTAPKHPDDFRVNGVTDILMVNERQAIITERSYTAGFRGSNIRVYLATMAKENEISEMSIKEQPYTPLQKTLLLDMDKLGMYIDNVEGLTWGPALADGRKTLVFVSDDNFSDSQETQFLVFALGRSN